MWPCDSDKESSPLLQTIFAYDTSKLSCVDNNGCIFYTSQPHNPFSKIQTLDLAVLNQRCHDETGFAQSTR